MDLEAGSVTLLHGEPSRINIHLKPNGLLGWEQVLAGDPAMDIIETIFDNLGQPDIDESEKSRFREVLLSRALLNRALK